MTSGTVARSQAPLSMGFPRQEYWSELPFLSSGDLPNPGIEPGSSAFQVDALTSEPPGIITAKYRSDTELSGLPMWLSGKELSCQYRRHKRLGFYLWIRRISWRRAWHPTPVFLPGKSHGQRSLVGYSPQDRKEPDTTEVT